MLETNFSQVEEQLLGNSAPKISHSLEQYLEAVFCSPTQAFREVLLGCLVARLQDKEINIRQPYVRQGSNAFGGRSLDEKVINRFLQDKRIPCSKGPYLSVFRRSVEFSSATRDGLRDKDGYDRLLDVLSYIEDVSQDSELVVVLRFVLFKFVELREQANVPLSKVHRISLEQFGDLLSGLLETPSGGRFPVLLIVAAFRTIKSYMDLNWEISWQGINVADIATGAAGDITIMSNGEILITAEVTERPVDRARVIATFNTKIATQGVEDYIFFVKPSTIHSDAELQMRQYFAQGHEVNFVPIKDWLVMVLATIGRRGRSIFNDNMLQLLEAEEVPVALRVSWNQQLERITTA